MNAPPLEDRMCYASSLDNPLRRRFAPAASELDLLELGPGQCVVDLGTGVGFLLPEVLRRIGPSGRAIAFDIDGENLAIARQRVGEDPRVTFRTGSAVEATGLPPQSCDRVLLSLVLCCLVDKKGALGRAWELLRPGGLVLVSYPRLGFPRPLRRRSLRVTPEIWRALVAAHAWEELPVPTSRLVSRHLLRRSLLAAKGT